MSIILGIDPGTRVTGYGVIKKERKKLTVLDFGAIRPPTSLTLHEKYLALHNAMEEILDMAKPDAVSIETQFVQKNVQSAMKLGMARGVLILAAAKRDIPIFEYSPSKAKSAVAGNGAASKGQIQKMIQLLLHLPILPTPEDAADALALAICHANQEVLHV